MKSYLTIVAVVLIGFVGTRAGESNRINDEQVQILLKFKTGLTTTTPLPVKLTDSQALLCSAPLNTDIHGNTWASFLVSTTALKEWKAQAKAYPKGTALVKIKYADDQGANTLLHTLMLKREQGYNSAGGDWEYVLADANGGVQVRGKLTSCMECHSRYKDTNCVAPVISHSAASK